MSYIEQIFEKANIRGIADYLLFGLAPDEDTRDYETRLEEVYEKYEKAVFQSEKKSTPELLDLSNDVTCETASVYLEIGIQVGFLLIMDIIRNIETLEKAGSGKIDESPNIATSKIISIIKSLGEQKSILNDLYKASIDNAVEETLRNDKKYQEVKMKVYDKIRELDNIKFAPKQWELIDEALSMSNEIGAEYGRVTYYQGFKDAVNLLEEIRQSIKQLSD